MGNFMEERSSKAYDVERLENIHKISRPAFSEYEDIGLGRQHRMNESSSEKKLNVPSIPNKPNIQKLDKENDKIYNKGNPRKNFNSLIDEQKWPKIEKINLENNNNKIIQITININREKIYVNYDPELTVLSIKNEIKEIYGYQIESQNLYLNNDLLNDNDIIKDLELKYN